MADVKLVVLDPYHPVWGLLTPIVAQRILSMSSQFHEEMDPLAIASAMMTRLWQQDPRQVVLLMVALDGKVVGHAVASIESDGINTWVFVPQIRADGDVGDAVPRALDMAIAWAREYSEKVLVPGHRKPIEDIVMATHRADAPWVKKYQFKTIRHVMRRRIDEEKDES